MYQRTHRCRTCHGIGKPCLQRKLGRFADCPSEEKGRRRDSKTRTHRPLLGGKAHKFLDIQSAETGEKKEEAHRHRRVSDACYHEGLYCRPAVGRVLIPETYKEVTAETHAFPSQVEEYQIVGQDQCEH